VWVRAALRWGLVPRLSPACGESWEMGEELKVESRKLKRERAVQSAR
jgi:hypothetical protein